MSKPKYNYKNPNKPTPYNNKLKSLQHHLPAVIFCGDSGFSMCFFYMSLKAGVFLQVLEM